MADQTFALFGTDVSVPQVPTDSYSYYGVLIASAVALALPIVVILLGWFGITAYGTDWVLFSVVDDVEEFLAIRFRDCLVYGFGFLISLIKYYTEEGFTNLYSS
uniref:Uncharacterized protein n=2 Tax=Strombidium inclinatum TaxID=197538 RepID=A0A7S3N526_9SPIT|mmetsp:Transcript_6959/g.11165  ORF Transcript_6959/g.11165 Transcript_6959/m.11165 type:complete len:104 (+) Transcript_6959:18-329(+)